VEFNEYPKCLYLGGDTQAALAVIVHDEKQEREQAKLGYLPGKKPAEEPKKPKK
jgi:hypothetical protein